MQIKKETVISVLTTSGETINAGDTVIFNFDDKCCVGVYLGLSDRGALKFKGKIADTDVTFHVMPRSIKEIYKADCYSMYDTWSGLGSYRQNFVNGVFVEDGMVAKVLNIAKHDRLHNFRLSLIQNPKTTQVFIININGIKKVER